MLHRCRATLVILSMVAEAAACDRRDAARVDSIRDTAAVDTSAAAPEAAWVQEVGRLLVIPADSDDSGVILFPLAPTRALVSSFSLTLLSSAGAATTARAALVESDSEVCGEAPTLRLVTPQTSTWSVAVAGTSLTPVAMDSIESMTAADSARLVTTIARLASTVPPRESRFTALPFVVLAARTFRNAGRETVVAHLRRRLPQEATPLEEHLFVVAERPSARLDVPYAVSYSQKSEGTEETADHYDLLAVLTGQASTFLILARDQEARSTYEILERSATGVWRTRWTRTLAC